MATTVTITITRHTGANQAAFGANPPMSAGDNAFWVNTDTVQAHHPAPAGQPAGTWLKFAIPPAVPGDPAPSSDSVSFDYSGDYPYVCALHPHETGTVHVS